MLESEQRLLRCVCVRADGPGWRDGAVIFIEGLVFAIAARTVDGGEAPCVCAVAFHVQWIGDAVCLAYQCLVAIVREVVGVVIAPAVRVVALVGILGEEERSG